MRGQEDVGRPTGRLVHPRIFGSSFGVEKTKRDYGMPSLKPLPTPTITNKIYGTGAICGQVGAIMQFGPEKEDPFLGESKHALVLGEIQGLEEERSGQPLVPQPSVSQPSVSQPSVSQPSVPQTWNLRKLKNPAVAKAYRLALAESVDGLLEELSSLAGGTGSQTAL